MIYDFTIEVSCEITVRHGFKYCGLIACDSSSQLGNSTSPTLYSLAQHSVIWVLTLVNDEGLEPNWIWLS
jgi:hypothetical protein